MEIVLLCVACLIALAVVIVGSWFFAFYIAKAIACGVIAAIKRMEKFYNGEDKK